MRGDVDAADDDADPRFRKWVAAQLKELSDRLVAIEGRLSQLERHSSAGGRVESYIEIVRFAQNRAARTPGDGAALEYSDIRDAAGCSHETAYKIMQDMDEEYDFAEHQDPEDRNQRLVLDFSDADARSILARLKGERGEP